LSATVPLYGGVIQGHKVGSFLKGGEAFQVVSPGYCIQGKRRGTWTQVVHEDIPVFTVKMDVPLTKVMEQFDRRWDSVIGKDRELMQRALAACKAEHRRKFRDGASGEEPAPTISRDGRATGPRYTA
jgi:hypothetical protein